MAIISDVYCEKNTENWCIDRGQDHGGDRDRFRMKACPLGNCSAESWKRAAAWSYESMDKTYAYVTHHLVNSAFHGMPVDQAYAKALEGELDIETETFLDRENDRAQEEAKRKKEAAREAEKEQSAKAHWEEQRRDNKRKEHWTSRRDPCPPSHPPPGRMPTTPIGGNRGSKRSRSEVDEKEKFGEVAATMTKAMSALTSAIEQQNRTVAAGPSVPDVSADGSGSVVALRTPTSVEVPIASLRLMHGSLQQVRQCAQTMTSMLPVLSAAEEAIWAQLNSIRN